MSNLHPHPASFKDPSGFVFTQGGEIYRQVNKRYTADYDQLIQSGLYSDLTARGLLIPHEDVTESVAGSDEYYKVLKPEKVAFISFPYEWCFEELKDAALLTLKVMRIALDHGMILKDATPYNVQLHRGSPVFIDTLSFTKYDPRQPWVAYRQFCKNFLFPLYLEHYLHTDIQKIMMAYMDGIPVDLTSKLLPLKSGLNLGVWLHVYLQNSVRSNDRANKSGGAFDSRKLLNMITHLESIITGFSSKTGNSTWSNYYSETILGQDYLKEKETVFRSMIDSLQFQTVLDLGANDGYFSKILAEGGAQVVATDNDSRTISTLYRYIRTKEVSNIHPVVLDVASPSPALGFRNKERSAFHDRVKPELVVALALVHHLVIGNNIPLQALAEYFSSFAPQLIIEFVPKSDEKVKQMLATREDVFDDYDERTFERSFQRFYLIRDRQLIQNSGRAIYSLTRINL